MYSSYGKLNIPSNLFALFILIIYISDFIEALLKTDPKVRLSAKQALDHPWIKTRTYPKNQKYLIRQAKTCFKTLLTFRVYIFIYIYIYNY